MLTHSVLFRKVRFVCVLAYFFQLSRKYGTKQLILFSILPLIWIQIKRFACVSYISCC